MEVGTEISQKIRSAIKAKLIELGAYVDDELPDYIMVMVANKKTREQMISDLNLFLGKNTDAFAEWLHGLLGKLQTISVESNAPKNVKTKKSDSKKEKKGKKSGKGEGKKVKSKKNDLTDGKKSDKLTDSKSKGQSEASNQTEAAQKSVVNDRKETNADAEVEDVRQMLVTVAPTDELAAELETTEARLEQSQKSVVQVQVEKSQCSDSRSRKDASNAASAVVQRKRSASPTSETRIHSSSAPKKHKGLTSVVASVVSKDEEEEEYDPLCPAVGSVASVVKVTNRKSKIPPALQANSDTGDLVALAMDVMEPDATRTAASVGSNSAALETGSVMVRVDQLTSMDRIKAALVEVLEQSKEDNSNVHDDIAAFCQSIASCLRKMNQRNLAIAKLRIQKILFDYESSIQAGGNDRWTASATTSNDRAGDSGANNFQISSSGNDRFTIQGASRQQSALNSNSPSVLPDGVGGTSSKSKLKQTSEPSVNISSASATRLDFPSSSSQHKSDQSIVTSSSKNHRLSPSSCSNQNQLSTKSLRNLHNNSSEINLSKPNPHQPSTSSNKSIDHSQNGPSQTISLDSLHLKRRSETELSTSRGSSSVLKFGSSPVGSSDNGQNSGMDSPKPLSAEQLRVLAKNLKITISNSQAKSSDDEESDSSSEGSDEDSDSEEDGDDDAEKGIKKGLKSSGVLEDSRGTEGQSISPVRRNSKLRTRESDDIVSTADPDDRDSDTDRNDIAAALARPRS